MPGCINRSAVRRKLGLTNQRSGRRRRLLANSLSTRGSGLVAACLARLAGARCRQRAFTCAADIRWDRARRKGLSRDFKLCRTIRAIVTICHTISRKLYVDPSMSPRQLSGSPLCCSMTQIDEIDSLGSWRDVWSAAHVATICLSSPAVHVIQLAPSPLAGITLRQISVDK